MSVLSMNSLSDAINDINAPNTNNNHNNNNNYSKTNKSRSRAHNHHYNNRNSKYDHPYEEKVPMYQTPNPSISFTATSTGTPIIIATNTQPIITGPASPRGPASTVGTPTSLGSARGENGEGNESDNNHSITNGDESVDKDGDSLSTDDSDSIVEGKRPSQYDNSRNLHVDNLPPITEVEFRSLFLPFGTIARSRIVTDVVTGLPSGYGFVMFEREEDAYRALHSLHNKVLPNTARPLRVTFKKPKSLKAVQREKEKEKEREELLTHGHQPSLSTLFVNTNLYVAGIPLPWKKKDLDDIFAPFGTILESRILTDRTSGLSKGVGFVRFQHLESCHQATKQLNGKPPAGAPPDSQNLTVRFAVDRTAQALAVAQQTVMASVGGGKSNEAKQSNVITMLPSRSYSNNPNQLSTTNTSTIAPSSAPLISPSAQMAHHQPNAATQQYLQLQAMIALQQQQQMMATRVAAAIRAGSDAQSTQTSAPYLYPFTQSALSMGVATSGSSPPMTVNSLNHLFNATNSASNTDPYMPTYSQVFV